jgi:hypothetical protein
MKFYHFQPQTCPNPSPLTATKSPSGHRGGPRDALHAVHQDAVLLGALTRLVKEVQDTFGWRERLVFDGFSTSFGGFSTSFWWVFHQFLVVVHRFLVVFHQEKSP